MPEHAELRIVADFINSKSNKKTFSKIWHVHKGNNPEDSKLIENFELTAESHGKELILRAKNESSICNISVFMGMTGNWKWASTDEWSETKFTRMRIDSTCGYSLLLFGYYMGPKYRVGGFTGVKRGPDPVKNFDSFKENILSNLDKNDFNKPICEVLLNQKYFNGIGTYLNAEIIGRLDFNPFKKFNSFSKQELDNLFNMIVKCCNESYENGGGELISWINPFNINSIRGWIQFYGNNEYCFRQKFGTRNIWIQKKFKSCSS